MDKQKTIGDITEEEAKEELAELRREIIDLKLFEQAALDIVAEVANSHFKFQVGQLVRHKLFGSGIGVVLERWIQECHGGTQRFYDLRIQAEDGGIKEGRLRITEMELKMVPDVIGKPCSIKTHEYQPPQTKEDSKDDD